MIKQILSAALVIWFVSVVQAQTNEVEGAQVQYVTDQLRLSLYAQADSQSGVIQLLSSGNKLIVEDVAGPYAKVTTSTGNIGWVKRGFLVSDPTSDILLKDVSKDNARLKEELKTLSNSKIVLDQYEADMDEMSAKMELMVQDTKAADELIASLKLEIQGLVEKENKQPPLLPMMIRIGELYWQYIGLSVLLIVLLSYFIGRKVTEANIKRKFQGIKVW